MEMKSEVLTVPNSTTFSDRRLAEIEAGDRS